AFSLIGIHNYLNIYGGDADVRKIRLALAGNLYRRFNENFDQDWLWPEDSLTYANGFLPSALILTGNDLKDGVMLQTGLDSLSWLLKQETHEAGHISVIGNKGWMPRNGERARFDQQPEEVMALVEACAEAFRVTSDNDWLMESRRCFDWFMGKNDLNIPVFDFKTGGCYDSLHPNGVNENMGAESTLAWLIALLNMYDIFAQEVLIKTKQEKSNTT
ncbi:MAG: glycosyl transferase family 1, partial [Deltaproteobacteria bacterium]|nr:glycosyl transferase family 1 [Deltaproteobacteria bacterium]